MSARLCLNMIVKNEASNIERCLAAAAPHISGAVIVDTGSTDGTQQIVAQFLEQRGIPLELHERRFDSFDRARNHALDMARCAPFGFDYLLLADADMELMVTSLHFREHLSEQGYHVLQRHRGDSLAYYNPRLLRRDVTAAHYIGVTHEVLIGIPHETKCDGIWFMDHATGSNRTDKFERDAKLLERDLRSDPSNTRSMFYLAQSYRDWGKLEPARGCYRKRAKMGGWAEEVWFSLFQVARIGEWLRLPREQTRQEYLQAFSARPCRAEPLYHLARLYREAGEPVMAFMFAKHGASLPHPSDRLFLDESVYRWRLLDELATSAYYAGAFEEGRNAAERLLLEPHLPASERSRVEANLRFYAEPRAA